MKFSLCLLGAKCVCVALPQAQFKGLMTTKKCLAEPLLQQLGSFAALSEQSILLWLVL
jgi:hypothetical protein